MRVSKLVDDIILADANHFTKDGFITADKYNRVKEWLEGDEDREIQLEIANWLEADAQYFDELAQALVSFHWFIYPFIAVFLQVVPKRLRKYAEELRNA